MSNISNPPRRLGILVSGRGSNLQAILNAVRDRSLPGSVAIVISDRPGVEALDRAEEFGAPTHCIDFSRYSSRESHENAVLDILKESEADLVVLAGYRRLVSSILINPFRNRMMNIHPSLLPAFPGLNAVRKALEYGVSISGCTVHFVDEEVDGGPVIVQAAVPVYWDDSVDSLSERILQQEHKIFPNAVRWFLNNQLKVKGRKVILQNVDHSRELYLMNPIDPGPP